MRLLSVRLIVSLIIGVTLVSLCTSYYQVLVLNRNLQKDLQRRAEVLGESLARNVERDLERDAPRAVKRTVQQFANREHLAGLAVYDPQGHPIAVTTNLQPLMESAPAIVLQALQQNHDTSAFLRMGSASIHIYALPLHRGDELIGSLAIIHDSGYIHR
jgi:trehalose 6-phosphate synthase